MKPTVAVIGGGVVGSLIARELTKYELKVILIEAREDIATGATGANSAIVHGGFDPVPGTLKAKLNVQGAAMMPALAEELGVSIDELFDLSPEQKLRRMENRLAAEEELPADVFGEYEEFLKNRLLERKEDLDAQRLLARLYHHRMEADARRVKKYARAVILAKPEKKDCQWLLDKAEGQFTWDWNMDNHASTIAFYKEVIEKDKGTPATPLPYYYLIDNLLADHRTAEARDYLEKVAALPACRPFLIPSNSASWKNRSWQV